MRTRTILRSLFWTATTVFFSAGWGHGCTDADTDSFRGSPTIVGSDQDLRATQISAVLNTPIKPGTNLAWCATFQLAWNQACNAAGGDLRYLNDGPMVADLNRHPVEPADMDPDSYIAVAGRVRDGIYDRIDRELEAKFHGRAQPRMKPDPAQTPRPQDIVAYSFLFQKLDFPTPFERIDAPIDFGGTNVAVFGMDYGKPGHEKMADGVGIADYKSTDDFVIELKTKNPKDHLLLAKVPPGQTLGETVESVRKRFESSTAVPAYPADVLKVPRMFFDVTRSYRELTDQLLIAPPDMLADKCKIHEAKQNIKFQIDEKGVVLQSEASVSILSCSADMTPVPVHVMVFDKPFLLMLIRDGRKVPYFAIWIDNIELLEYAGK